jgi:hypothetical protein
MALASVTGIHRQENEISILIPCNQVEGLKHGLTPLAPFWQDTAVTGWLSQWVARLWRKPQRI